MSSQQGLSFFCETRRGPSAGEVAREFWWKMGASRASHTLALQAPGLTDTRSAWPTLRAGLGPQRPCLPVRPGPQRLPWKWPGSPLAPHVVPHSWNRAFGGRGGGVPDRVLTVSRLDARAPWCLVQQTLHGEPWVPEMLLGTPQPVAHGREEGHTSRLHRAAVSRGGWPGRGTEPGTVERSRTSVAPARARSQRRAGGGWLQMPSSRETGQTRTKRPHCQRHCRQRGRTRCPRGLAPNDASPLQMGMQAQLPLGENPTSHIVWFLPTSPAQPQPPCGEETLVRTWGQLGAVCQVRNCRLRGAEARRARHPGVPTGASRSGVGEEEGLISGGGRAGR